MLAAEIPDLESGGLARDGMSVTWKLKPNVRWHDGKPFTADDVVFTSEYAADPATAAVSIGSYKDAKVEKIDPLTVRVRFAKPTPYWANAFVGWRGMIIPKHLFEPFKGDKSRDAPANLKPVGTGPYRFASFNPGDLVTGELNRDYHEPNRPHFDTIEMKGGGDAVSAARAVLQTGEYDFAWNIQVEDEILLRLEKAGKGRVEIDRGGRRRALEHQDQASVAVRSGGAPSPRPSGRSRVGAGAHLRPDRRPERQFPQLSGALPVERHEVGVQYR
jgi:peptide/nickel transport system substrate-binding protein